MLGAMVVGGIYGGLVGLLKAKYGIHEVITSIMFNWIALYVNNFYVSSSGLKKPNSEAVYEIQKTAYINVLQTWKDNPDKVAVLKESPVWGDIIIRTDLNYGIIIAIICAIIVWFIINKTTLGYSLKAVGFNKDAAEFAGIDVKKSMFISMAIAGAIAGLAGAIYITGMNPHRIGTLSLHENYGFNGLSVALISAINPIACIFGGLFYGSLKFGGTLVQSQLGTPTEIINIMIGVIVYFISIKTIVNIVAGKIKLAKKADKGATSQ
jgi:simple sugar transport system permease protein